MSTKDVEKKTNSTRFLLRGVGLKRKVLEDYGFINAYIDDKHHEPHYTEALYLLFQPKDINELNIFLEIEKERTNLYVEDYDYSGGYVVVVYKFPKEYEKEYRLFLQGKYSKFSKKYKELYPMERKGTTARGIPFTEPTLHNHVFNRTESMKQHWEERLNVELTGDMEYWSIPDITEETLNIENYERD